MRSPAEGTDCKLSVENLDAVAKQHTVAMVASASTATDGSLNSGCIETSSCTVLLYLDASMNSKYVSLKCNTAVVLPF